MTKTYFTTVKHNGNYYSADLIVTPEQSPDNIRGSRLKSIDAPVPQLPEPGTPEREAIISLFVEKANTQ